MPSANSAPRTSRLARGYKAGGFNIGDAVPADRRSFDAEVLHNLELGFRATSADAHACRRCRALLYAPQGPAGADRRTAGARRSADFRAVHRQCRGRRELRDGRHLAVAADRFAAGRPARRATRDALHRLRRTANATSTGASRRTHRSTNTISAWNIAVHAACSRASISPGSTISTSTTRTMNVHRRGC